MPRSRSQEVEIDAIFSIATCLNAFDAIFAIPIWLMCFHLTSYYSLWLMLPVTLVLADYLLLSTVMMQWHICGLTWMIPS